MNCGQKACFHGAYKKKSDAVKKAKQRGGSVLERVLRGIGRRFVVVTSK